MLRKCLNDLFFYYILQNQYAKVIVDIAKVGPEYLPGHAHADTLSFELMVGEQPVFVNLGTSCYEASSRRLFERSSKAHNTVVINQQSSSEVWSTFRVARRAHAKLFEINDNDPVLGIKAQHNGYQRLKKGLLHTREWLLNQNTLIISDSINKRCDAFAYLHLHPNCQIIENLKNAIMVRLPNQETITIDIGQGYKIIKNKYVGSFGKLAVTHSVCVALIPKQTCMVKIHW